MSSVLSFKEFQKAMDERASELSQQRIKIRADMKAEIYNDLFIKFEEVISENLNRVLEAGYYYSIEDFISSEEIDNYQQYLSKEDFKSLSEELIQHLYDKYQKDLGYDIELTPEFNAYYVVIKFKIKFD